MNEMSGVKWLPRTVYTQQGAKLAYEQDIIAKFLHLLSAQLPRTQFTHSKAPNPHARKTSTQFFCSSYWHSYPEHTLHTASCPHGSDASTQNFRTSYWHSYPERRLHTASCQTRMAATHQHKIFAPPIGTATPSDVYTQQAAKPAWQRRINTTFSHLPLAQLPRAMFTHSKPPNPHGSDASTAAAQRRHRAPQPLLEALDTAPAAETEAAA